MAKQKLTDLTVQRLPVPPKGQKTYWENGFGVRVSQGGTKTFVVMYGPDRRLKTIGRYPRISLKQARDDARRFQLTQSSSYRPKTFSEAREAFLAECQARNRPGTVANYRRLLSAIDAKLISDVTKSSVPNNPHAIMAAKIFFNWCIRNELTDRNPFAAVRVSYNQRSRVLSDSEIAMIWAYDDPPYTDHLKLLLLTGQRRGQFTDFEVRDDTLFFPARIMKGKQDHTVPLLPHAKAYATTLKPFSGWSKSKARMDKTVLIPHWTIHDLRRTFATIHARIGTPIHVIEKILDHRSGAISGVALIYNRHSYLLESRKALEKYEAYLQTLIA